MAMQLLAGYDHLVEHVVAGVFLHPAPFEARRGARLCAAHYILELLLAPTMTGMTGVTL